MDKPLIVLRDTSERDKKGWFFENMKSANLFTGDYTIEGYEKIVIIERKGNISEFAHNIWEQRFENELQRMDTFKYSFLILEFDLSDVMFFPESSQIPKRKWKDLKTTAKSILKRICEIECKYKTKVIFAGKFGQNIAESIFKRVMECHLI